jgi:hypothetical protein
LNTDNVGFQPPLKGGGDRLAQRGWVGWSYTQTCIGGDQKGDSNLIRGVEVGAACYIWDLKVKTWPNM